MQNWLGKDTCIFLDILQDVIIKKQYVLMRFNPLRLQI